MMISTLLLDEQFRDQRLTEGLAWHGEPQSWFIDTELSQLVLHTEENTDFWQKTHYGFQADSGHFLYTATPKNFRMTTKVIARPKSRYDQAGLMIRFSEELWIKTSVEYIAEGTGKLGAVVTNRGYSDWSTQSVALPGGEIEMFFRLSKIGQNSYADYSWDGEHWSQIRVAHLDLPPGAPVYAGLYACSPQGKELEVRFDFLTLEELGDDPNEAYL